MASELGSMSYYANFEKIKLTLNDIRNISYNFKIPKNSFSTLYNIRFNSAFFISFVNTKNKLCKPRYEYIEPHHRLWEPQSAVSITTTNMM